MTFLSDARQPEVSLFLFNMPWHHQICITLKETICLKICSKSRLKSAQSPLSVDVRRSKTENRIYSPPREVVSKIILFVYSLRGALIKIARGCHTRWRNYFDGTG